MNVFRRVAVSLTLLVVAVLGAARPAAAEQLEEAVFAMGCFWCGEEAMEKVPGVVSVDSGYTGGTTENPTYYEVIRGGTGHLEAVQVIYDAEQITYEQLLPYFWHNVNPLQGNGQFCDLGASYVSAIFYEDDVQKAAAEASLAAVLEANPSWSVEDVKTEIRPAATFYKAEEHHQDYYLKNPAPYFSYKKGCRRVDTLKTVWGEEAYNMYHPVPDMDGGENYDAGGGGSASGGSATLTGGSNPGSESDEPDDSGSSLRVSLAAIAMACFAVVGLTILL